MIVLLLSEQVIPNIPPKTLLEFGLSNSVIPPVCCTSSAEPREMCEEYPAGSWAKDSSEG